MTPSPSEIVQRFTHDVPVDLEAMAAELGLRLKYDAAMPDNVSGKIYRDKRSPSGFSIAVNAGHSENRQRFTIAHEIAHYVLHRDLISDVTDDALYRSSLSNTYERQANKYAAKILLPADAVRSEFKKAPYAFLLANRFNVSERAMEIRLAELGLG